jgi:hypothetical protein
VAGATAAAVLVAAVTAAEAAAMVVRGRRTPLLSNGRRCTANERWLPPLLQARQRGDGGAWSLGECVCVGRPKRCNAGCVHLLSGQKAPPPGVFVRVRTQLASEHYQSHTQSCGLPSHTTKQNLRAEHDAACAAPLTCILDSMLAAENARATIDFCSLRR